MLLQFYGPVLLCTCFTEPLCNHLTSTVSQTRGNFRAVDSLDRSRDEKRKGKQGSSPSSRTIFAWASGFVASQNCTEYFVGSASPQTTGSPTGHVLEAYLADWATSWPPVLKYHCTTTSTPAHLSIANTSKHPQITSAVGSVEKLVQSS